MGDGAAAGAYRVDIDHGHTGGQATHLALGSVFRNSILYQRNIGTGSSHIIGDDVQETSRLGNVNGAHNPRAGAGQGRLDRGLNGGGDGHDAAVGLGDVGLHPDTHLADAILQVVDVHFHPGAQIGVDHRGAETFKLPKLRKNGGGDGAVDLGPGLLDALLYNSLVFRVQEGEQEAYRQRLHTLFLQLAEYPQHLVPIYLSEDGAVGHGTFVHLPAKRAAHQGLRFVLHNIIQGGACLTADFQQVPEALCGDQSGLRALALNNHVGCNRGAVAKILQLLHRDPVERQSFFCPVCNCF